MTPSGAYQRIDRWLGALLSRPLDEAMAVDWSPDAATDYCPRCGVSVAIEAVSAEGCPHCRGRAVSWDRITRLSGYGEPMSSWIQAMKFQRQWRLGPWLGEHLARVLEPAIADRQVVVTTVPMHWRRRWARGYNPPDLIAQALGRRRGWPVAPLLKRVRHAPPQSTQSASQRRTNVRRCFAAPPVDLKGLDILLIDDVKTTGATLSACSRLLKQRGARSIHAAVAAVAGGGV